MRLRWAITNHIIEKEGGVGDKMCMEVGAIGLFAFFEGVQGTPRKSHFLGGKYVLYGLL